MTIKKSAESGFTLVEIMIVVALIGLLASIATPTWVKARSNSQMKTCVNNLRQIDAAVQQWALETKQAPANPVLFSDISSYLKHSVVCPSGGSTATFGSTYSLTTVGEKPTCQIGNAWSAPYTHALPTDTTN